MLRAALLLPLAILNFLFANSQLPELTSSDKTSPIILQKLDVGVKIIGTRSATTFTMTFRNPANRVLEGTFVIPLPEGATVTRYALDINGKMREGVPVEQAKATEVFESVEKRRIDPGLLERTEGNVFRTRIYPIPSGGERSIIIAYEQELSTSGHNELHYHLPLHSGAALPKFSLSLDLQDRVNEPALKSSPIKGLKFLHDKGHYCASEARENIRLDKPLSISIAKGDRDAESFVQKKDGDYYFFLQAFIPPTTIEKKLPKNLAVVWDNSLSGLYRNTAKEVELLEAYLKRLGTATIRLYTLNNTFRQAGVYEVKGGQSKGLSEKLHGMIYDGGTDLSTMRFPEADETLLFTDGLSTLSDPVGHSLLHPVITVSSSPKANFSLLKDLAQGSGGTFVNLQTNGLKEALTALTMQPLVFLGIKENGAVTEHYPSGPVPVQEALALSGRLNAPATTITLQFGYGRKVAFERAVQLSYEEYGEEDWDLSRLFAQKKIQDLERDYERNREQILQLGRQHSLVTQGTSLLVLEDVMDYVRNEIEPPLELRADYKRLLKERKEELSQNRHNRLETAIEYSNALWQWYNTTYPKKGTGIKKFTVSEVVDSAAMAMDEGSARMAAPPPPPRALQESHQLREVQTVNMEAIKIREQSLQGVLEGKVAGVQVQDVVVAGNAGAASRVTIRGISSAPVNSNGPLLIVDGKPAATMPPQNQIKLMEVLEPKTGVALYGSRAIQGVLVVTTRGEGERQPQIKLAEKTSSASYMRVLAKAPRGQQYQTYLSLRENNLLNPNFYYDVAAFFLKQDRALGLQVLTNLGELDFRNHELHKLFGYKLKEVGAKDQQLFIFRKILQWRPQEPQSYRDYALALADAGRYGAALDTLYTALTREYNTDIMDNYSGIEETIVMEINNLVARHPSLLKTAQIDRRLLHPMPVDIRVVLNWNMNDTDMDLWVTDPGGEKCHYSNPETRIGGRLSEDMTQGYGPEQFLLKNAKKGKYKIQVHYYGERGVKIAGKTTLLVEVFTHYGRNSEQGRLITLQLEGEEKEGIYVGEFEF